MHKLIGLMIAAALLCLSGAVVAEPFEDGLAAYKRQDYLTALRLWRPLADHGNAAAQNNLGRMYYAGQGVPQDYAEAVKWYRKAANQGFAPGQQDLGIMYNRGQGVPQDYVQAHQWLNLAATTGDPLAVQNRDSVATKMTPAQIAEAQKLAREWKPKPEK